MPAQAKKMPSTEKYLPIKEIRDDLVILKDGTLRRVLLVSSLNFALKSEEEQKGIIQGYVQMLNSLDFSLQVVIQSRKMDISDYLNRLKESSKMQTNELLKVQTEEYWRYVSDLVNVADIMDKRFYVVVPYSPFSNKKKNFWTKLYEVFTPGTAIKLNDQKLAKYKEELDRRAGLVNEGLSSLGLNVVVLDTRSLIELYYQTYNPNQSSLTAASDINKLRIEQ